MKKNLNRFLVTIILTVFLLINIDNILTEKLGKNSGIVMAQNSPITIEKQGQQVLVNNRKVNLPWIQWQEGNQTHIGISDIGAETLLGIELINNNESNKQPIYWFGYYETLATKFINPYRYLDLTNLLIKTPIKATIEDDLLNINLLPVQINKAYEIPELKGKKILIELDHPTFFQVSQGKDQGFIRIDGQVNQAILEEFKPRELQPLPIIEENEGEQGTGLNNQELEKPLFIVNQEQNQTIFAINLPPFYNLKVTSAKPSLLLVELKPDALTEKEIKWTNDIEWSKKYISINSFLNNEKNSLFLVNYLTLNLKDYNLDILPITPNQNTVIGTAPLQQTSQKLGAIAAINGGFFNRNNQLPLGAIKNRENWLSSPILKRAVIAWNEVGKVKIDHLELQEVISLSTGDRFVGNYLNSGYIEAGISRYTTDWGISYTNLSDNEIIIVVENDRIKEQIKAGKAGQDNITIPLQGYLLVFRKVDNLADKFALNQEISVKTLTNPPDFAQYPYIMGAGPLLLLNRQIVLNGEAENFSKAFNQQKASRSAIAINSEGKLMFVAVHNRVGGAGPSLLELAQILQKMGAIDALNLDGGSSTQIYLGGQIIDRSSATAAKVNNGIGVFLRQRN